MDEENLQSILYSTPVPEHPENYYMLFVYADGRVSKVPLTRFSLESNRKEFKNAYSAHSPLVWIRMLENDNDVVIFSDINKVVVFNTAQINPVKLTSSKGVMVQKPKNNSKVLNVNLLEETNLTDAEYYRCKNIPAVGVYLKKTNEQ